MAERANDVAGLPGGSRGLQVGWWPGPDAKLDKSVRTALLRRMRTAPGLKKGITRPRTRALRLLAVDRIERVHLTRSATAPSGEWLMHDLDDGGEVAWGYRPDGVRGILEHNRWPTLMEPGDATTIFVVTWPSDLAASGYETPTYDLSLAWATGACTVALATS